MYMDKLKCKKQACAICKNTYNGIAERPPSFLKLIIVERCWSFSNVFVANSVCPDQTACLYALAFACSRQLQQATFSHAFL